MRKEVLLKLDSAAVGHHEGKLLKEARTQKAANVRECFLIPPVATMPEFLSQSTVWLWRVMGKVTFQGM